MFLQPYLFCFCMFNLMRGISTAPSYQWSPKIIELGKSQTCHNFLEFASIGNGSVSCVSDKPILMDVRFDKLNEKGIPFTIYPEYKLCNQSKYKTLNGSAKYFELVLKINKTVINPLGSLYSNIDIDCKNEELVIGIQAGFEPVGAEYILSNIEAKTRTPKKVEIGGFDTWPNASIKPQSVKVYCPVNYSFEWNQVSTKFTCTSYILETTNSSLADFAGCENLLTCRLHAKSKLLEGSCRAHYIPRYCVKNPWRCQPTQFPSAHHGNGILYCKNHLYVFGMPFFKYLNPENDTFLRTLFKNDDAILETFVQLKFQPDSPNAMKFYCFAPKFLAIPGFTWNIVAKTYTAADSSSFECNSERQNTDDFAGEMCILPKPNHCLDPCNFRISCRIYFQNGKEYESNTNCNFLTQNCSSISRMPQPNRTTQGIPKVTEASTTTISHDTPYHSTFVEINTSTPSVTPGHIGSDNTNSNLTSTKSSTSGPSLPVTLVRTASNEQADPKNFATNRMEYSGEINLITTTEPLNNDGSNEKSWGTILAVVMGVLLLILLPVLLRYYRKSKQRKRELVSSEEIRHFLEGAIQINNSSNSKYQSAMVVPYDMKLEIPRRKITLDTKVLGKGNFGKVVQGYIGERSVAVKMLDKSVDAKYFHAILSELKIMSYVGKHENIVELVGAITEKIRNRDVYVILEFCHNGNALDYVRARRDVFLDLITESAIAPGVSKFTQRETLKYENFNSKRLSSKDLIRWSMEIAAGMDFVASKNVCHGDLAARNILLSNHLVAKVGDFGLAKQLTEYSLYVQKKECPLPLKWMSIESLRDLEFSIQSDVWSYGITVWELFSLGCTPYPGMDWNFQAWKTLLEGQRMDRAEFASPEIHDILLKCWETKPNDRPQFSSLQEMFATELEKVTSRICQRKMLSVNLDFTHNI